MGGGGEGGKIGGSPGVLGGGEERGLMRNEIWGFGLRMRRGLRGGLGLM